MSVFSERLKQLQNEKKLLKKNIAESIGVTYRHYQRYENDEAEPTLSVVIALCKYLEISSDWLLGLSDIKERK